MVGLAQAWSSCRCHLISASSLGITHTARRLTHVAYPSHSVPSQEHYKYGGHRTACRAYVLAAAVDAQQERECTAAVEVDRCLICLEPPREPMRLPCGHSFCTGCVAELRSKGVSQACPLCRAPLPPGPEKLYELAQRVRAKLVLSVERPDYSWAPLSASQQEEMDGAIVMLREAKDQVSDGWSRDI